MTDISTFIKGSGILRKLAMRLASQEESNLDFFEETDREEGLRRALKQISAAVQDQSTLDGSLRDFLTGLIGFCSDSLKRPSLTVQNMSTPSVKSTPSTKSRKVLNSESEVPSPATEAPVKPLARKRGRRPPKKSKSKKEKLVTPQEEQQLPSEKDVASVASSDESKKEKNKTPRLLRKLLPRDFPVSHNTAHLSDRAFTLDHQGAVVFEKRWDADEIKICQQGDLHEAGSCLICDNFRVHVDYFTHIGEKEIDKEFWLPKLTPYQFRLCVMAHAYALSYAIDFEKFTEGYELVDVEKVPNHPRLNEPIILEADGTRSDLPTHLGISPSKMSRSRRTTLTDVRKTLPVTDWTME